MRPLQVHEFDGAFDSIMEPQHISPYSGDIRTQREGIEESLDYKIRPLEHFEIESAYDYLLRTGVVKKTPLESYPDLYSQEEGTVDLYLKREDLQDVSSFKIRGAFNAISLLGEDEKRKGVVCASAGNHAQGFAMACAYFKVKGTVFVPISAPDVKVEATRKFGGEYVDIQQIGENFDEAKAASQDFVQSYDAKFIDPFNDSGVIIGTSTIGYEIFQQMEEIGKKVDYIFAPVGGGGLISGIIEAKNIYSPETQIVSVEPSGHRSMLASVSAGEVVTLKNPNTTRFADGTAVACVGDMTFDIVSRNQTHCIHVQRDRLATYLKILKENKGIILEPSGVLSVAGVGNEIDKYIGKTVVSILSGANIDQSRVDRIEPLHVDHNQFRASNGRPPIVY